MNARYLFVLILSAFTIQVQAQLVDVIATVAATGPIGELPAGYTTYKIYARLQDPNDRVSAVYGSSSPSPAHRLSMGSTLEQDALWNSNLAGSLGSDASCILWDIYPEVEFDSYVTIGLSNSINDGCPDCAGTQSGVSSFAIPADAFSSAVGVPDNASGPLPDLLVWNGTYLLESETSCNGFGQAPDNRVLIAQASVPSGTLEYCFNIIVLNEGNFNDGIAYVHNMDDAPGSTGIWEEVDGSDMGLCFGGTVSVPEPAEAMYFRIYPNPADENAVITWDQSMEISEIRIYHATGQLVATYNNITEQQQSLNTGTFEQGAYFITAVDSRGKCYSSRMVVY